MLSNYTINGNDILVINSRHFTVDNTGFEITDTQVTGPGLYDAVHTVKNLTTGNKKQVNHYKLLGLLKSNNP